MALSTLAKERENFLLYAILTVDHSKTALTDLVELNLKNKHQTFEEFLNQSQHEIYHLCYESRCCQCSRLTIQQRRIIHPSQMELLFDKHNKIPGHRSTRRNDNCCSYAKPGVTTDVLDLSLAACILLNCCLEVFWFSCLTFQGQTLEEFLNSNKHTIYHFWRNNQPCCQCQPGTIYPSDRSVMTETEWNGIFKANLEPCVIDRKRSTGGSTSVCSFVAKPGIALKDICINLQRIIIMYCCPLRKDVGLLVQRNREYSHMKKAALTDVDFNDFSKETANCLLKIARVCGKEPEVKDSIRNLGVGPVDATLCSSYQNTLLGTINRNESISEKEEKGCKEDLNMAGGGPGDGNQLKMHAKLGYIVLRLFSIIMQMIMREYITPTGIKTKYNNECLRVPLTKAEIALMDQLPNTDKFTVCLCYKILRFEHLVNEPHGGWISEPKDTQLHIGSDIQRILCKTNELLRTKTYDITEAYCKKFINNVEEIVCRVDKYLASDTCLTAFKKIRIDMENIDEYECFKELETLQPIGGPKEFEILMNQAIEKENHSECNFLLENYVDGDITEILSSLLETALKTHDAKIKEMMFHLVVKESPIFIKEFCKTYPNGWMGIECKCDQENVKQYEHAIWCQGKPLFIVDIMDSKPSDRFLGFKISFNETRPSPVGEATQIAVNMAQDLRTNLDNVPGSVAKEMFRKYSNLTMICPSRFKSRGFYSANAKIEEKRCIQLFCTRKGIIPIGESHFPLAINGIPTDVLEGTANLSSGINIGDKIVNGGKQTGTLGGFVKYYGIDTFLTCSHVVFGKDNISKLQKKHVHFNCNFICSTNTEPVECLLISHILKYDSVEKDMDVDGGDQKSLPSQDNPDETSIDAALLLVQIPKVSNKFRSQIMGIKPAWLADSDPLVRSDDPYSQPETSPVELRIWSGGEITNSQFKEYGLDRVYLNDNCLNLEDVTNQAVALSAYSGKQAGYVNVQKEKEVNIVIPTHVRTRDHMIFYNQLTIQNMTFQAGDSGTCVYGKCSVSGKTGCIGMLIGRSTSGHFIVTPMKDILKAFGVN